MRRVFVYFILVACCFTMVNCQKQCRQRFNQRHKPEIKKDEYNSCDVILRNFYVFEDILGEGPSILSEHNGDTLMVCGWVCNRSYANSSSPSVIFISDDPRDTIRNHSWGDYRLMISGLKGLPSDFSYSKKCYVIGKFKFGGYVGDDADIKSNRPLCKVYPFSIQAINIYFE